MQGPVARICGPTMGAPVDPHGPRLRLRAFTGKGGNGLMREPPVGGQLSAPPDPRGLGVLGKSSRGSQ